ncbi:Threonylcarbamoyladenosine tRNA methylthiotransferase [Sorochytrium milnesiophthora]
MDELEDIEELTRTLDDVDAQHGRASYRQVGVKRFRGTPKNHQSTAAEGSGDFLRPGTASVYVKTWGCSHNNSDSEYMAGLLSAHGYRIVDHPDSADLWLLNSCTVKNPSEQTFVNEITRGTEAGKKVVLAGCVPQAQPSNKHWDGLSVVGVQQIDRVVEVVEEALKGHTVRLLETKKDADTRKKSGGARLNLPKIRKNPLIEIIPINTGCLNQCTYCKTKHARGDLGSYPPDEIVARVEQVVQEGVCEIWLTSEDTGTYGRDIGASLPDLLWRIVRVLPDGVMLRLGMTNPPYILEHLEEVAKILAHPRVYEFLHVPVQAGSDRVLHDMRRQYTCADFCHVVDFLHERLPSVTIATDIICGFPTESDVDFDDTIAVVEKYRFPVLHISQFYPRPGTPAARLQRIPTNIVKQRSRQVTALFESYTSYDRYMGQTQRVLVTEVASDKLHLVGHNKYYHQILIPQKDGLLGCTADVEIIGTGKHYMKGKLLRILLPPRTAGSPQAVIRADPPVNNHHSAALPTLPTSYAIAMVVLGMISMLNGLLRTSNTAIAVLSFAFGFVCLFLSLQSLSVPVVDFKRQFDVPDILDRPHKAKNQ